MKKYGNYGSILNGHGLKKMNRVKFGIEVPNNVCHALLLDKKKGNNAWSEAILKKMSALTTAGVWEFKPLKLSPRW